MRCPRAIHNPFLGGLGCDSPDVASCRCDYNGDDRTCFKTGILSVLEYFGTGKVPPEVN